METHTWKDGLYVDTGPWGKRKEIQGCGLRAPYYIELHNTLNLNMQMTYLIHNKEIVHEFVQILVKPYQLNIGHMS